jgi:hypothetical protein
MFTAFCYNINRLIFTDFNVQEYEASQKLPKINQQFILKWFQVVVIFRTKSKEFSKLFRWDSLNTWNIHILLTDRQNVKILSFCLRKLSCCLDNRDFESTQKYQYDFTKHKINLRFLTKSRESRFFSYKLQPRINFAVGFINPLKIKYLKQKPQKLC